MELLVMCLEFFKTGLFAIGGGLATLPFLYEMAEKYPWFTTAQLSDMIAVSESTPGPIGVNMATYAGFSAFGLLGAVMATFSLVLPSIIVILIVAKFLQKFRDSRAVNSVMEGLRPASVGMVAAAAFGIVKIAFLTPVVWQNMPLINYKAIVLAALIAVIYHFRRKWHPIVFILMGAVGGLVLKL